MLKKGITILLMMSALLTALSGCAESNKPGTTVSSEKSVVELKFNHHDPPTGSAHLGAQEWVKLVEEKSNGTLKFTIFPSETLSKAKDAYDSVIGGVSDISWCTISYTAGRFPMTEVFNLPMLGLQSVNHTANVMWDLYNKTDYLKKEYTDVKLLMMLSSPPGTVIGSSKKAIRKLEDLKGLKVVTTSKVNIDFLDKAGAVPSLIPASDIYESMQRGVVDAYFVPWAAANNFRLNEVSKYHTSVQFSVSPRFIAINKQKFDSLPDEAKKAIEAYSGPAGAAVFAKHIDAAEVKVKTLIQGDSTKELIDLSAEEIARWQDVSLSIWDGWVQNKEKQNLPGKAMLEEVARMIENSAVK